MDAFLRSLRGGSPAPADIASRATAARPATTAPRARSATRAPPGIEYLTGYYRSAEDFDGQSITALLAADSPALRALRASPSCALLFYVFDLDDRTEEGRFRCVQVNPIAELHERGALFDNVWWHYALFHGKVDGHVVVQFVHQSTYDTGFGALEAVGR